jgi:glycosyltransferase involved in cell wall biosynthesis
MTERRTRLSVLAPVRYPWRFNSPRTSVHDIAIRTFVPFNKFSQKIEGITLFNPFPLKHFDLIHAFNRIPLGRTPFIIGFESHLPRAFGMEDTSYFQYLVRRLAGPQCRKIVAISDHARRIFAAQHRDSPLFPALEAKLITRFPNVEVPDTADAMLDAPADPLILTFVGNHFARKGGCVAVKMAEMALERGLPVLVHIVSALEAGGSIWTDPPEASFHEPYLKLLELPNVRHHRNLPNQEVTALLRRSHFSLLPTFSDTFGYSAIESMINHTPVIATSQGALPEFIRHGENGILLDLPVNEAGEWAFSSPGERHTERYRKLFASEIQRLAGDAVTALLKVMETPGALAAMRLKAREDAVANFNASDAARFWDDLYLKAVDA